MQRGKNCKKESENNQKGKRHMMDGKILLKKDKWRPLELQADIVLHAYPELSSCCK